MNAILPNTFQGDVLPFAGDVDLISAKKRFHGVLPNLQNAWNKALARGTFFSSRISAVTSLSLVISLALLPNQTTATTSNYLVPPKTVSLQLTAHLSH